MKKKLVKKKTKKKALGSKLRKSAKKPGPSPSPRANLPKNDEIAALLTMQTAGLELGRNEYVEFAATRGCVGPIKLSGNSLPTFTYRVFDPQKKPFMMEFVKVRVEISKPNRIQYTAHIDAKGTVDAKRHGEHVEVKPEYKIPFEILAAHLLDYFPFPSQSMFNRPQERVGTPKILEPELPQILDCPVCQKLRVSEMKAPSMCGAV